MSAADRPISASLVEALALVDQGLPCFPCRADKSPATPRGFKDATCDPDIVRELFERHPGPLIGVPTGEVSGFDVLDIDRRQGGNAWFLEHAARLPPFSVERLDWIDDYSQAVWLMARITSELGQDRFLDWVSSIVKPLNGDVVEAGFSYPPHAA